MSNKAAAGCIFAVAGLAVLVMIALIAGSHNSNSPMSEIKPLLGRGTETQAKSDIAAAISEAKYEEWAHLTMAKDRLGVSKCSSTAQSSWWRRGRGYWSSATAMSTLHH